MSGHTITSVAELEALYGTANPNSIAKEVPHLTAEYRRWIEASPFFVIASGGPGGLDCSPRGDAAGQLHKVLDDKTLVIPDRRGNNRLDTLRNLMSDDRVALIFFAPGVNETIRVNGTAHVTTDPEILDQFESHGKRPVTALVVSIASVYFQCARALVRSQLWSAESHLQKDAVPTAGQMIKGALPDFDAAAYEAELPERQKRTLY